MVFTPYLEGRWQSLFCRKSPVPAYDDLDALGDHNRGSATLYVFQREQRFSETGASQVVSCPYRVVSRFLDYQWTVENVNHRRHQPNAKLFLEVTPLNGKRTCWGLVVESGKLIGIFRADGHYQSDQDRSATPISPLLLEGIYPNVTAKFWREIAALLPVDGT